MNNKVVDLRSDARSDLSLAMRHSILDAPLGDAVHDEDPTVMELERMGAELLEKEAALFLPSGTMANLISVLNHSWIRGAEVIVGDNSHIYLYEQGGMSQVGGVHPRVIPNLPDGTFDISRLRDSVRADNQHFPITSLVCVENTHNMSGGRILPLQWLNELGECCRELKLPLHMDGARLLNAAVGLDVPPAKLVRDCDSVTLCLCKGVGGPVGALLLGKREFIERGKRLRNVLGGGMRQCGILAAPSIIGLMNYHHTLRTDHRTANIIAKAIALVGSRLVTLSLEGVETNIVIMECWAPFTSALLVEKLKEVRHEFDVSVLSLAVKNRHVRLVTYNKVTVEDAEKAAEKISSVIRKTENHLNQAHNTIK